MPVLTERSDVLEQLARVREANVVMPVFCFDSIMNLEANLAAVQDYAREHGIENPVVAPSITYDYGPMSQVRRITRRGSPEENLELAFYFMERFCGKPDSTYGNVIVLPHYDHADAVEEEAVWNKYKDKFATVFIDASLGDRTLEQNKELTARQVAKYMDHFVIEAALQRPAVEGHHGADAIDITDEEYAQQAKDYLDDTGADLLVVELGSKQQAVGWADYNSERCQAVSKALGDSKLVLHGGSSIPLEQQASMAYDGIIRFNIWSRVAREGARAGAWAILKRVWDIFVRGDPNQLYSTSYTDAHFDKQVDSMKAVLGAIGYDRLAA